MVFVVGDLSIPCCWPIAYGSWYTAIAQFSFMLAVQCMYTWRFVFLFICSLAESLDISAELYNEFVLHLKSSNDQFQYQECIFFFIIGLIYYGWAVANAHSATLDPCPSDDILERIKVFVLARDVIMNQAINSFLMLSQNLQNHFVKVNVLFQHL